MSDYHKSPQARRDLVEIADYLARTSLALSDRFLAAAEQSFASAAEMPDLGSPWETNEPELAGLRFVTVKGFKNHLVFYLTRPDSITVVRVFQSGRDIATILEGEGE